MRHSNDPTYPLFSIMSFLGFVVALIPFPWHLQAWNSGTCAFMLWASISCLVEFVNSVIWTGNYNNTLPVWCDISSKFLLGAGVGITASSLCISRRLYTISTTSNVSISHAEKRRAVIIDLCISLGIPVLVMALHYVVQPHRYDILEDIGCYPAIYNTLPAYFLVFMWPVLLGCISFVYSALTFHTFWKRRIQFAQLLSSNSSLSIGRYIRLMVLALTDMLFTVPLGVFSIYFGTQGVGLAPWISWEDTHYNFSRVVQVPALYWRGDPSYLASVELTRWIYVASAFIFFALFGFAEEAKRNYKRAFWACVKPFGFKPSMDIKSKATSSLPSWKKPVDQKINTTGSIPMFVQKSALSSPASRTPPLTGKSSKFSFFSSSEATVRVDVDVEKYTDAYRPKSPSPSTSTGIYSYPPSSRYSLDESPSTSPNLHDSSLHHPHDPHLTNAL